MAEMLDSRSILVRRALPDDAPALASLHARCFTRPWDSRTISQFLDVAGCLVLVGAWEDSDPKAFLIVRAAADEAELLTICVSPDHRRRGFARTLLASAAGQLGGCGTKCLFLEVDEENEPALALYRALGAVKVGRRSAYYEHGADAVIFSLALSG